jgi:hypothetical protein
MKGDDGPDVLSSDTGARRLSSSSQREERKDKAIANSSDAKVGVLVAAPTFWVKWNNWENCSGFALSST